MVSCYTTLAPLPRLCIGPACEASLSAGIERGTCDLARMNDVCSDAQVLVDVPCFTDRQVVTEHENNMFTTGRTAERLELPEIQQELL